MAGQPVRICYVSAAEDKRWRGRLVKHLAPLRHEGLLIELPEKMPEGEQALEDQLAQADLILLLLSADFFASPGTMQLAELALARYTAGQVQLIPVRLHPVDYALSPINQLQALPANGEPISNARRPDKVLEQVAQVLRSIVEGMAGVSPSDKAFNVPGAQGPQRAFSGVMRAAPVWNVPLARNPFFCGQDAFLAQLHTRLQAEQALPQAICGLGGCGKTQVAGEYAYRYRAEYQAVLWVQAETYEALVVSFAELAQLLQLAGSHAQDQIVAVQAVMRWLASQRGWLLILDNVDELSVVRAFLPASGQGHVLLTTRTQTFGLLAEGCEVPRLDEQEGALFLLRRARVLDREQGLEQATPGERRAAFEVVAMMGGLPLALDQAGAYIEGTQTDILRYAELFKAQRTQLLKRRGAMATHTTEHPQPVATTLTLSFERVELANPTAADLLRSCAFLHPETIPETLFTEGASAAGTSMLGSTHDPVALDEAVQTLRSYSLIHRDPDTRTLSIHRLVQAVIRDGMSEEQWRRWFERVVKSGYCLFPDPNEIITWDLWKIYVLHVQFLVTFAKLQKINIHELSFLCNRAGSYLHKRGQYGEAEPLLEYAITSLEELDGPDQPGIVSSLRGLAELYITIHKYRQAEQLYQRALWINERSFGVDHPEVAECLNDMAEIYRLQGKHKRAVSTLRKAISINEQAFGSSHTYIAFCLSNLAKLYEDKGEWNKAEKTLQKAQSIIEQTLGKTHPDLAIVLTNLAMLYDLQGNYEQAEGLYQQALFIREQAFGMDYPETAKSLNNLAACYAEQNKYEQAEPLLLRALSINEQRLVPEHPNILMSLNNLASFYRDQAKYEQADFLFQRALTNAEQNLGTEHPVLATILENQAELFLKMNRNIDASMLASRAKMIRLNRKH